MCSVRKHVFFITIFHLIFLFFPDVYQKPGELMLGGLFRVREYSSTEPCSDQMRTQKSFQYHEGMVHAVNRINMEQDVLPNITLGFSILDDCVKDQVPLWLKDKY